jgi:hypothetical protein
MPIIAIPTKAVEKLAELEAEAEKHLGGDWDRAYCDGFVEGLRSVLSSEVVGLIIVEADNLRNDEPGLPRLVFK